MLLGRAVPLWGLIPVPVVLCLLGLSYVVLRLATRGKPEELLPASSRVSCWRCGSGR